MKQIIKGQPNGRQVTGRECPFGFFEASVGAYPRAIWLKIENHEGIIIINMSYWQSRPEDQPGDKPSFWRKGVEDDLFIDPIPLDWTLTVGPKK